MFFVFLFSFGFRTLMLFCFFFSLLLLLFCLMLHHVFGCIVIISVAFFLFYISFIFFCLYVCYYILKIHTISTKHFPNTHAAKRILVLPLCVFVFLYFSFPLFGWHRVDIPRWWWDGGCYINAPVFSHVPRFRQTFERTGNAFIWVETEPDARTSCYSFILARTIVCVSFLFSLPFASIWVLNILARIRKEWPIYLI